MNSSNVICLLIPHYNDPEGLKESVVSISENEYLDIVIVDDGSTNLFNEEEIRESFKANGKISFDYFKVNKGVDNALNKGISIILENPNYKYLARLDCGDICLPNRFDTQLKFLEKNLEIFLLGSWATAINPNGKELFTLKLPIEHKDILKKMYLNCMFLHPTVMVRVIGIRQIGCYPTGYIAGEDYAYFFKWIRNYETANIPEVLVKFRVDDRGISRAQRKNQLWTRIRIVKENFYFGFYPIYGIVRNLVLLIIPYPFINLVKKWIYKS